MHFTDEKTEADRDYQDQDTGQDHRASEWLKMGFKPRLSDSRI